MSKIPTDISGYQFCDSYEVGATKIENCQMLCRTRNRAKGNR